LATPTRQAALTPQMRPTQQLTPGNVWIAGDVGIGTTTPLAKLDVAGEIKVGNIGLRCEPDTKGALRYNSGDDKIEYCSANGWKSAFGGSCPEGSLDSGYGFCVDPDERGSLPWYDAFLACGNLGGRLCTMDEFYIGGKFVANIRRMSDNWEWVMELEEDPFTCNTGTCPRGNACSMGGGGFYGNIYCEEPRLNHPRPYRCCYDHRSVSFKTVIPVTPK
jgi:hypothetical protein